MNKTHYNFLLIIFLTVIISSSCKNSENSVKNQTKNTIANNKSGFLYPYAGCDELGRVLTDNETVGNLKQNRQAGIFYFLWQGDKSSKISENQWDLSELIPLYPEVLENGSSPDWGSIHRGYYYYWGKPIYGYYRGDDYWVHLKSMQLLSIADIDFLIIDATNTLIYTEQSETLMQAIETVQKQGIKVPKIVYYTNTRSGETMQKIYDAYYKPGAPHYHPDTWYYLEGKPLIIGITKEAEGKEFESFFTFRESQWPNEPVKSNGWPWIDFQRPQTVHLNSRGEREIINVSVAQHPNPAAGMGGSAFYGNTDNWGRSYRNNSHGNPITDIAYGYNFQEQWDYALTQDVPFIFITGWNEWVAGRWKSTDENPEHSYFCDQASPEYSRDIEPTRTSGINDNYYMQLISNVRRYKGMNDIPKAGSKKTIKKISDWQKIKPVYFDFIDDTGHRNHPGAQTNPAKTYINNTGQNDFHIMKVARNKKDIWFYAETKNEISKNNGDSWMRLYINSDRKYDKGWFGYDFRINAGKYLQKFSNGKWENIYEVNAVQNKNKLMYSFPLNYIFNDTENLNFEFKWSDNMQDENDPLDWYINGDAAPDGRLNYIYKTK